MRGLTDTIRSKHETDGIRDLPPPGWNAGSSHAAPDSACRARGAAADVVQPAAVGAGRDFPAVAHQQGCGGCRTEPDVHPGRLGFHGLQLPARHGPGISPVRLSSGRAERLCALQIRGGAGHKRQQRTGCPPAFAEGEHAVLRSGRALRTLGGQGWRSHGQCRPQGRHLPRQSPQLQIQGSQARHHGGEVGGGASGVCDAAAGECIRQRPQRTEALHGGWRHQDGGTGYLLPAERPEIQAARGLDERQCQQLQAGLHQGSPVFRSALYTH